MLWRLKIVIMLSSFILLSVPARKHIQSLLCLKNVLHAVTLLFVSLRPESIIYRIIQNSEDLMVLKQVSRPTVAELAQKQQGAGVSASEHSEIGEAPLSLMVKKKVSRVLCHAAS